jgi:hypothetical protein
MKISWGWKIVALYSSFVVLIVFMVFKSINQDFHMVRQDYYGAETEHEAHMIKVRNSQKLVQKLSIESNDGEVRLVFPEHMEGITGKVTFYRPSDANLDQEYSISLDPANSQRISTREMKSGKWLVRVEWGDGEKEYFDEKVMVL